MPSPAKIDIQPLVETDQILALNKPPGLPTTGRDLDDEDCLQYQVMAREGAMVWALHQLDKNTSGVVLFARKKSAVQRWQRRWTDGQIQKYYVALVHGSLSESPLRIEAPIKRLARPGYTEVAIADDGKPAITEVKQLSSTGPYSLVIVRLLTGRTHQIRAHLQHVGCPLIGEKLYNSIPCAHHNRQALHAMAITTDQSAPLDCIKAPFPDDLRQLATRLGIDLAPLALWMAGLPSN